MKTCTGFLVSLSTVDGRAIIIATDGEVVDPGTVINENFLKNEGYIRHFFATFYWT